MTERKKELIAGVMIIALFSAGWYFGTGKDLIDNFNSIKRSYSTFKLFNDENFYCNEIIKCDNFIYYVDSAKSYWGFLDMIVEVDVVIENKSGEEQVVDNSNFALNNMSDIVYPDLEDMITLADGEGCECKLIYHLGDESNADINKMFLEVEDIQIELGHPDPENEEELIGVYRPTTQSMFDEIVIFHKIDGDYELYTHDLDYDYSIDPMSTEEPAFCGDYEGLMNYVELISDDELLYNTEIYNRVY